MIVRLRKRVGTGLVDGFLRGLSRAGMLHPEMRATQRAVEVLRDIAYVDDGTAEHRLDVYRPRAPTVDGSLRPCVLYVHGGGFRILSKDTHWVMGYSFARRGYTVFNINYRLSPAHRFPDGLTDAAQALLWLGQNAARFGADPARLVLAGESAGANLVTSLALCLSYRRSEPWARALYDSGLRAAALLPACGILQVSDVERFMRRKKIPAFVADRMAIVRDDYLGTPGSADALAPSGGALDLADPLLVLERGIPPTRPLPPCLAICGTSDPLLDDTRRLDVAYRALAAPIEIGVYPGQLHAFHALFFRNAAKRAWQQTFDFLDRYL